MMHFNVIIDAIIFESTLCIFELETLLCGRTDLLYLKPAFYRVS